nr:LAETG motif-containing sortase-dependent surface protein [Streptomyces sp. SID8379]
MLEVACRRTSGRLLVTAKSVTARSRSRRRFSCDRGNLPPSRASCGGEGRRPVSSPRPWSTPVNRLVPVRSAVLATGLLAALAATPAAHATATAQPSEKPSVAATATPSPAPTGSTPKPTATASVPPSVEPSAEPSAAPTSDGATAPEAPSPVPSQDELAHTGSSNTSTTVMGAGAVVLVAGGAGALFAVRRRSHR